MMSQWFPEIKCLIKEPMKATDFCLLSSCHIHRGPFGKHKFSDGVCHGLPGRSQNSSQRMKGGENMIEHSCRPNLHEKQSLCLFDSAHMVTTRDLGLLASTVTLKE